MENIKSEKEKFVKKNINKVVQNIKNNPKNEEVKIEEPKSLPLKKFTTGSISATIWNNKTKEGNIYYTITLTRRYKSEDNNWHSSNNLRINDLPKAIMVLQKAYEYLVLKNKPFITRDINSTISNKEMLI